MEELPENRIVFAGNPGVGKSTLLNTIIGKVTFRSGVCLLTGMTTVLANQIVGNWMYTDTPGLDDAVTREMAAKEISTALKTKIGGNIKLIFVMTLEAGRIRGIDMATMIQILEALEQVGIDVNYKFSILLNKVSKRVLEELESSSRVRVLFSQVNLKYRVGHAGYMEFRCDADDVDNHILNERERLLEFLMTAPYIKVTTGSEIHVRADKYDKTLEEMNSRLQELEQEKEERNKLIAKIQQEKEEQFRMIERERDEHRQSMLRVRDEHERRIARMEQEKGDIKSQISNARSPEIVNEYGILTVMCQQIQESNRMILQEREERYKMMVRLQGEAEERNKRMIEIQREASTSSAEDDWKSSLATGAGIGLAGLALTGACSIQ